MRIPEAPSVSLQPERAPALTAPAVRPAQDAGGAQTRQLGQAVEQAGQATYRVGEVLQRRVDVGWAKKNAAHLSEAYRELLTAPDGYMNAIGQDAIDRRPGVLEALEEKRRELGATALNEVQQSMWEEESTNAYQRAVGMVDSNYGQQTRAFALAGAKANAQSTGADLVESWFHSDQNEFDRLEAKLFGAEGELAQLFGLQGMPPEQAKLLTQEARDGVYTAIVGRLMKQSPDRAKTLLDSLTEQGKLSGAASAALQDPLREAGLKERAFNTARAARQQSGGVLEQQAWIDQELDAKRISFEQADLAKDELYQGWQRQRQVQSETRANALAAAKQEFKLNRIGKNSMLLSDATRQSLKDVGALAEMEVWIDEDGNDAPTAHGRRMLAFFEGDPKALLAYGSAAAAVQGIGRFNLGLDGEKTLSVMWAKANKEQLSAEQERQLTTRKSAEAFLRQNGILDFEKIDDRMSNRIDQFLAEVTQRETEIVGDSKGNKTGSTWIQAMTEAFNNNSLVWDGKRWPASMLTPAEQVKSTLSFRRPDAPATEEEFVVQWGDLNNQTVYTKQVLRRDDGTETVIDNLPAGVPTSLPTLEKLRAAAAAEGVPDSMFLKWAHGQVVDLFETLEDANRKNLDERARLESSSRPAILASVGQEYEHLMMTKTAEFRRKGATVDVSMFGIPGTAPVANWVEFTGKSLKELAHEVAVEEINRRHAVQFRDYHITPLDVLHATGRMTTQEAKDTILRRPINLDVSRFVGGK